jgi:hypothetical protein
MAVERRRVKPITPTRNRQNKSSPPCRSAAGRLV